MMRDTSLAVQIRGEEATIVSVGIGKHRPFTVEWIDRFPRRGMAATSHRAQLAERGEQVVQTLPGDQVQLTFMQLPALTAAETQRAVVGNILRERGGHPGDWAFSYSPLPRRPTAGKIAGREVLVLSAAQDEVTWHLDHARRWGCEPERMLPDYQALDELYRAHGPRSASVAWNLVYLGARRRFLCVGDESCILMNRTLPTDLSQGKDPNTYLDQIATEIERSNFFAQQTERSVRVDRVVLCGDKELAHQLKARLSNGSTREVLVWDIAVLFESTESVIATDLFIPLASAAARFLQPTVNLLPRRSRARISRKLRRHLLLGFGTIAAALAPMLLVGGQLTAGIQDTYLRRANASLSVAEERARVAEAAYNDHHSLLARETLIQEVVGDRPDLGAILLEMALITPRQITYRELVMSAAGDGDYTIELAGDSLAPTGVAAQQALLDFLAALVAHPNLRLIREPTDLRLTSLNDGETEQAQVLFSLECRLERNRTRPHVMARKE